MVPTRPDRAAMESSTRKLATSLDGEPGAVRRELVQRIVSSPTFARSERMEALLTYVCDMALQGREAELNEQRIGYAVFGRKQDYDSSVDGIVRSQASRLRQRLDLYFKHEGASEPIWVSIPRGAYVPVFEARPVPTEPVVSLPKVEILPEVAPPVLAVSPANWLPWSLTFLLTCLVATLWLHDRRHEPAIADPKPHPFWSHVFTRNEPTLVVAPDSGLVLFHGMSGHDVNLKQYMDADYRSESETFPQTFPQIGPSATRQESLLDLANRRYTPIVDLQTILRLKDRAQSLGGAVSVRYARDLRPDDFKTGNVVLLGSPEADPWDELYELNRNFVLKNDYRNVFSILNRNPRNGEPDHWEARRDDPQRRVYGVVAYMPSLAGHGNALLLEGTGMSGTEAGMDFVLDDAQLLPFLQQVRHPNGVLSHFEVLLETTNVGASAVRSRIVAWRAFD